MMVRHIRVEDAKDYLQLRKQLDEESIYRLYEPGENMMNSEGQREAINRIMASHNSTILVAEADGELVGYLAAQGRPEKRIRHITHISLAIRQQYTSKGIGTRFFMELESWAKGQGISRLELSVMVNNPAGIALYKKMGFAEEGTKRHGMCIGGEYVDELYMSKLL